MKALKHFLIPSIVTTVMIVSGCGDQTAETPKEELDTTPTYVPDSPQVLEELQIGEQVWSTENLRVVTFRNGDPIPEAKSHDDWEQATLDGTPAWCVYGNDPANVEKYGLLYNWHAIHDPRGLAPKGWHIPSVPDWTVMTDTLGRYEKAGKEMKSTTGWAQDGNGTNSSGFNGKPGGLRDSDGDFHREGYWGYWWSVTDEDEHYLVYTLFSDLRSVIRHPHEKGDGASVRCMKGDRAIATGGEEPAGE